MIDAATIAVILFGLSFVGIKQTTSPPITFLDFTHCSNAFASSMLKPLKLGSKLETAGAIVESKLSRSKVIYMGLSPIFSNV